MNTKPNGGQQPADAAKPRIAWTIAGSDSGGGAGIQADLATFRDFGVHGCSVITAITGQNSFAVGYVEPVSRKALAAQINALDCDLPAAAIKVGMLANNDIVASVAKYLAGCRGIVVYDPVLHASNGASLGTGDGTEAKGTIVLSGGTLSVTSAYTSNEFTVLSGNGVGNIGAITSSTDYSGGIRLDSASRITSTGGNFRLFRQINLNGQNVEFQANNQIEIQNGGITGAGNITKTGGETLNINGTQVHGVGSNLITAGGTTNLNTNAGGLNQNLTVTTTGVGSVTNFGVSQRLNAINVQSGGLATVTSATAATVNGGKVLLTNSVTADTGKIDLRCRPDGDSGSGAPAAWELSVTDHGPGIAPQHRQRLFDAFARGETHGQPGVGLGLAIAAQAAKLLGGRLTFESEVGAGSTFRVLIPEMRRDPTDPT